MGSTLLVLDALKMSRHASHFSIPQAIVYTLQLAQAQAERQARGAHAPMLTLFTDLTHATEHHATEASLQDLLEGLRAYLAAHPAEATKPSWWSAAWNDRANEASQSLALRGGVNAPSTGVPSEFVPAIHLAYDGLRVHFDKDSAPIP